MFDRDQFITDCRAALAADNSHKNVREVVARAVSDPAAILKGLGDHRPAPALIEPLIRHSTVGDLGDDKSISRGLKLPPAGSALQRKIFGRIGFCSAKFFSP
jgi:hypothetical protein